MRAHLTGVWNHRYNKHNIIISMCGITSSVTFDDCDVRSCNFARLVTRPNSIFKMSTLPHFASGTVVKGFGRGSKELGIPTANYPENVVAKLPAELQTGVYCGWACVDQGDVHKMVLSLGWNPYYKNEKKSMETHIMHEFKDDFYGSNLSIVVLAYIRPEKSFNSKDELISAIKSDITESNRILDLPVNQTFKTDNFFRNDEPRL